MMTPVGFADPTILRQAPPQVLDTIGFLGLWRQTTCPEFKGIKTVALYDHNPAQRQLDKVLRYFYTRPHMAVELPGPPGGAREGLGVRVGVTA